MDKNRLQVTSKYGFGVMTLVLGLVFNFFEIGKDFLGFQSVGNWLIYIGFVMLAIITLQKFSNKKRIVDERMMHIAHKASRITFVAILFSAFIVMIADGIKTITTSYSLFMSYLICYMVIIYLISYKILEKFN